jgi:prepilin-type processing-associated H-X9-DG protein
MGGSVRTNSMRPGGSCVCRRAGAGFSLVELLTVLGLIALLIGFLLPTLQLARRSSQRTACASNLRQLGTAIVLYAHHNQGWIPRDATKNRPDRAPWPILLSPYLTGRRDVTEAQLPRLPVFQCPSHPIDGVPTGFVINAFAFETKPDWAPDGPIKITAPSRASELPWLLDAASDFPIAAPPPQPEKVLGVEFHDVYSPEHLPDGDKHRISDTRHVQRTANVLYLDGHVSVIHQAELKLSMFDDGVRVRATTMPQTTPTP